MDEYLGRAHKALTKAKAMTHDGCVETGDVPSEWYDAPEGTDFDEAGEPVSDRAKELTRLEEALQDALDKVWAALPAIEAAEDAFLAIRKLYSPAP